MSAVRTKPDWEVAIQELEAAVPPGVKCASMQYIKFREQAEYPEGSPYSPCSGREAFVERYIKSVLKFAPGLGVGMNIIWEGNVAVHSSGEEYDYFVITWYDTREEAIKILKEPEFTKVSCVHRNAAALRQHVTFGILTDRDPLPWRQGKPNPSFA